MRLVYMYGLRSAQGEKWSGFVAGIEVSCFGIVPRLENNDLRDEFMLRALSPFLKVYG